MKEVVEIVDNAVELRSFIGLEADITLHRGEDTRSKRSVDALKQFEEAKQISASS